MVWRRKARFAVARPRLGCRAGRGRVGRGSREISNSSRVQGRTGPDRPGTGQGCCGLVALAFSEVQALWQATQRQRVFRFRFWLGGALIEQFTTISYKLANKRSLPNQVTIHCACLLNKRLGVWKRARMSTTAHQLSTTTTTTTHVLVQGRFRGDVALWGMISVLISRRGPSRTSSNTTVARRNGCAPFPPD